MAQRKREHTKQESQPTSTPPIPLGANSGGPAPLTGNRTARLSQADEKKEAAKKPKRQSKMLEFQCKVSNYANDHHIRMPKNWHMPRLAIIAACAMIVGLMVTMNASTIATAAVLNANDQVLLTIMETNPDALAHILNAVNVGE